MSDHLVFVSQSELICAILGNLDQQYPGSCINQSTMNAIINAATQITQTANAGGLTPKKKTT